MAEHFGQDVQLSDDRILTEMKAFKQKQRHALYEDILSTPVYSPFIYSHTI